MVTPALKLLDERYSIHRLYNSAEIPPQVFGSAFFNIVKTDDALSIVCPSSLEIPGERCDPDWACLEVQGPLALDSCGILAELSRVLAEAGISLFAVSTFDTDYLLIKWYKREEATAVLAAAGYRFV